MSYVQRYEIGNAKINTPFTCFSYELPLLSFQDVKHAVNLSLVFSSRLIGQNPFSIANGYKLNLQKRLVIVGGLPKYYEDSDGSWVELIKMTNAHIYAFADNSQRVIRLVNINNDEYVLENPDFSTEHFTTLGRITRIKDKYGEQYLTFVYRDDSLTKLSYIKYRNDKRIKFVYECFGALSSIEYECGGQTICTTSIAYNGSAHAMVTHYSGTKYYVAYNNNVLTAYSVKNGSTTYSNDYSQRINCEITRDSNGTTGEITGITIEKEIGNKLVDSTNYDFINRFETDTATGISKCDLLQITDFQGIVSRVQFKDYTPTYSYEYDASQFPNDQSAAAGFEYKCNISIHDADGVVGTQTTTSAKKMRYDSVWNNWYLDIAVSNENIKQGYATISGWVKPKSDYTIDDGATDYCYIDVFDESSAYRNSFIVDGIRPDSWKFFTFTFILLDANTKLESIRVETRTSKLLMTDFRIAPQHDNFSEDYCSHISFIEDVLIDENTGISFPLILGFPFYNGATLIDQIITAKDILKYKLNQKYGTYTGEIYYNNCHGVISNAGDFTIAYGDGNGNTVNVDINTLAIGKRYYKHGNTYITKTNFNGNQLITTSYVDMENAPDITISKDTYDSNLDLVKTESDGIKTTITRNAAGLIVSQSVTSENLSAQSVSYAYDPTASVLEYMTDEFGTEEYETDSVWGVITKVKRNGVTVTDEFDLDKYARVSRTFADNSTSKRHSFTYSDPEGNMTLLQSFNLNYAFTYNTGEVTEVKKCGTTIEGYSVSSDYKSVTVTCPSHSTSCEYDDYGRLTEITGEITNTYAVDPIYDEEDKVFTYTKLSNGSALTNGSAKLAESTDSVIGNTEKYAYDLERLRKIDVFNSSNAQIAEENFYYDGIGRITSDEYLLNSSATPVVKETKSYVTAETSPNPDSRVANYSFIKNGSTMVYASNSYDSLKRLSQKSITVGDYDATKIYTYGSKGLIGAEERHDGTFTHSYSWDFDAFGRITEESDSGSNGYTNKYTYDSYGQLTREENEQCGKIINYTYDSIGNITAASTYSYPNEAKLSDDSYVYSESSPDMLVSFNSKAITYNSDGCVSTYDGWNYKWNKGRLVSMSKGGGSPFSGAASQSYSFTYNGRGQRTSKTYSNFPGLITQIDYLRSRTTNYTYDIKGRLLSETRTSMYSDNTSVVRKLEYLYEGTEAVGVIYTVGQTSGVYYYDKNHKGDVVAILDSNGNTVVKYKYDSYGNCSYLGSTNSDLAQSNPIRYRSYYYDEDTGLYYLNARYYNPKWRRFISPDSASYLDPDTPNGLNLYAYCNNDPVNYCDPSGHSATALLFASFVVGAIVGGTTSAISQWIEDKEINPWLVFSDAMFGGISGIIAASGISALGSAFLGASLSSLQLAVTSGISGEKITAIDYLLATTFGFVGGFIPKAGFNAKQVAGKWNVLNMHIKNAVSDRRFYMYSAKLIESRMKVIVYGINYIVSTIGTAIASEYISNNLERYYYGH